ncbi:hypothetical protein MBGDF03_01139 [Thermoplasmatales archaeon SCGC AB-540-F20]|nr:hypothetical protein MBGDF03_01139 [Thermoplasmatales archaeon SCGC AB-540-F20]
MEIIYNGDDGQFYDERGKRLSFIQEQHVIEGDKNK